jgi:uncharacterized RDD family membrane protein YckC
MTPDPDLQPEFYDGVPAKRLLAWCVDTILTLLLTILILPFTGFAGLFVFLPLMAVVGFVYRVITLGNRSATWGMRLMSLEFRDASDARMDLTLAFLHTLGYTLSFAMAPAQLVSIIMMCTTARGQGLSDIVLGTVILNRRRIS